ncbi:MAG: hypothetical protein NVS1B14_01970 [Vulcanimicrobiaceae bacterium]
MSMLWHGGLAVSRRANADYEQAKRYLARDSRERVIFRTLEHGAHRVYVRINSRNNDSYDAATRTIHWDPHSALKTTLGGTQSPALGLAHEADHATVCPWRRSAGWAHALQRYDNAEERRVIRGSELHAARTLGEAARFDHRGRCYRVGSPIER